MKFRRLSSIIVTVILAGHLISAIVYGGMLIKFGTILNRPDTGTEGTATSSYAKYFKFWFLDYRIDYRNIYTRDRGREVSNILILDIGYLIPDVSHTDDHRIELFCKTDIEEINIPARSSSIFIPFNHKHEMILYILISLISFLVIGYSFIVFYQIKRIIDSLKMGSPFIPLNVRRLFRIGIMVFFLPILFILIDLYLFYWINATYNFHGFSIRPDFKFNIALFAGGILVMLIAEIFKQGVRIKEEQDLTI
jgi:hypothetical protein